MSSRKTWFGIAAGGGGALIGGAAAHAVRFVNCAHPAWGMDCAVTGLRLGAAGHVGGGLSLAIMTGVSSKRDVEGLKSSGVDFAIDMAGRWGTLIEMGGLLGKAARTLSAVDDVGKLQMYVASEEGKALVNYLTGDLGLSHGTPSFAMIGLPLGTGVGGGVWYEWQSVMPFGSMEAWECLPPKWRLKHRFGELWLQMKGIPAEDGTELVVFGKKFQLGIDGVIHFAPPRGRGRKRTYSIGQVRDGMLWEDTRQYKNQVKAPREGGLNLTWRTWGTVRGLFGNTAIRGNSSFKMGVGLRMDGELVWESVEASKVVVSPNTSLSKLTPDSDWLM